MAAKKKVVDAFNDDKGRIRAVQLQGNSTPTDKETAIRMVERGQIEGLHVVHGPTMDYLRTNPDRRVTDNLDYLADH